MIKNFFAAAALAALVSISPVAGVYQAQAADVTFLTAQKPGDWLAHRLVGTKVLNADGVKIGDVNDVVIGPTGNVAAYVIGVGGYLGFNEKSVAVSAYDVTIGDVLGGSRIVVLNTTTEALKAAPPYTMTDPTKTDRLKKLAKDWGEKAATKAKELSKQAAEKARELKEKAEDAAKKQMAK